jgi:hypothetical protein
MSLRAFHFVFMLSAIALSLLVGVWGVRSFQQAHDQSHLALGVGSFVSAVLLVGYLLWFRRKTIGSPS